jgi:hypothetical protein
MLGDFLERYAQVAELHWAPIRQPLGSPTTLIPLPYPESHRLVRVHQTKGGWMDSPNSQLRSFALRFPISVPTFNDWT